MNWLVPIDIGTVMGLIFAWAVLALALAFRLFRFPDLTVEGSLPLGGAVFAVLTRANTPWPLAVLGAFTAGAMAGGLTAVLHAKFRVNKFLAGILVVAISYSACLRIMAAPNIGLLNFENVFDKLAARYGSEWGFHWATIVFLSALVGASAFVVRAALSSRRGLRLRVAGSNPEYARSLGIGVTGNLMFGLGITNGFAALSGVLLAMKQGFADVSMGQGVLILALAALTIGERLVSEKHWSLPAYVIIAAVSGSVVYQVIVSYAVRFGLAPTDLKLASAGLVLLVIGFRVSRYRDLLEEGVE